MRRRPGQLVPLERAICATALVLERGGVDSFHGYRIAHELRDRRGARTLTAYGTLYRALARLEQMGLLESRWEDPEIPAREGRPGRRLYALTPAGRVVVEAADEARDAAVRLARRPGEGLAPA